MRGRGCARGRGPLRGARPGDRAWRVPRRAAAAVLPGPLRRDRCAPRGGPDGGSAEEAWDTYTRVLAAWQAGETGVRFPGGEDCAELCARLRRALAAVARGAGDTRSLVVAHGANLRAALPGLAGEPDPG